MGEEGPPEGVCGYEFNPEWLYKQEAQQSCCIRKTLPDANRCAWHANSDETDHKTVENLKEARVPPGEREIVSNRRKELLDGAIIPGMTIGNNILFDNASLRDADISRADLCGSKFTEANLTKTVFHHANLANADFADSVLIDANFVHADISNTDFLFANLSECALLRADLSNSDLAHANLTDAVLIDVDFTDANLIYTDFSDASLRGANLTDVHLNTTNLNCAILEQSNLTRANLISADLRETKLHGALLKDVRIDRNTKFGDHYADELDGGTTENFDKAAWSLRQIQRLFEENAFPKKAREAKIERKNLRRRENWAKAPIPSPFRRVVAWEKRAVGRLKRGARTLVNSSDEEEEKDEDTPTIDRPLEVDEKGGFLALRSWAWLALSGFVSRYAESPRRVVGVSLLTIVAFGLLYPFFGGMETSATSSTQYAFYTTTFTVPEQVETFFYNLYFSAVTFTTLGYGDIQPATPATQTLASVQSFLGALLMALLVYVFGRQSTR
jgi:uncharacterized protein YjbI with pentapeptide repeats